MLINAKIDTIDARFAPALFGVTYIDMFKEIAKEAAKKVRGMPGIDSSVRRKEGQGSANNR
jgi:hypothetical protein